MLSHNPYAKMDSVQANGVLSSFGDVHCAGNAYEEFVCSTEMTYKETRAGFLALFPRQIARRWVS